MKLSILDQSPVVKGKSAKEALEESAKLAQIGERLGYTRYWIAEHHDMDLLASSVPEVMLAYIGAQTSHIRLGSGAVLLPHYKAYKVAEIYNMLETLFPNRIDVGIGRAPGGSAEASIALSGNFLENVRKMPETLDDLLCFLYGSFPDDHPFSKVRAQPIPNQPPKLWLLGTSDKSARLAAKHRMGYAFGYFMSDHDAKDIINTYREEFPESEDSNKPYVIVAVSVLCAETSKQAEQLANETIILSNQFNKQDKNASNPIVIGDPQEVTKELEKINEIYKADELMLVTITPDYKSRANSYELIAKELLFN